MFPWGILQSAWTLLDRTVEAQTMQGLCSLGVRKFVAFAELWYAAPLIPCWNSQDDCDQHPKQ